MFKKINNIYIQIPDIVKPEGSVAIYLNDAKTGLLKGFDYTPNMFVTSGKVSIAQRLRGLDMAEITYCAVGTGNTAPALSNTTLQTELERKLISTREVSSGAANASVFTTFYNTTEANGALKEFGLFGDAATASINTGTLFARTLSTRTKSTADTLTVEWTVLIG
jgi:hypothetical protein